jgi:hypothetical protein
VLGAGVIVAMDFEDAQKTQHTQQGAVRTQVAALEVTDQY